MKRRHTSPAERLADYSKPGPASRLGTPCLLWTGYIRPDGYGDLSVNGKLRRVHRMAFELANGPIPGGHDIDHRCHNDTECADGLDCLHRRCIEPTHLRAVPRKVNASAGRTGMTLTGVLGDRCPRGHEMTEANTIRAFGRRWCATCKQERKARLRAS